MTVEPNTALATFKTYYIMTRAIYWSKGKEDKSKQLEAYLVDIYESLLKTYNYNPEYIVKEKASTNSISTGAMIEGIESA